MELEIKRADFLAQVEGVCFNKTVFEEIFKTFIECLIFLTIFD